MATSPSPAAPTSAPSQRVTFPVTGMTCAACQSTVERALVRTDGVAAASVNLMLHAATVTYDPARVGLPQLLDAVRDVGYDAAPPQLDDLLGAPAARAAAGADEAGAGGLWLKSGVSLAAGVLAMLFGMPLMVPAGHAGHLTSADPFMRWTATVVGPWLQAIAARPLCPAAVAHRLDAPGGHGRRDGLGRPGLLRARLAQRPPRHRRHEHAGRRRHRRGLRLLDRRDARARAVRQCRRRAGCLLRGGAVHHRPRADGSGAGSPRQAPDDTRAGPARRAPAAGGPRPRSPMAARRSGRSAPCAPATS